MLTIVLFGAVLIILIVVLPFVLNEAKRFIQDFVEDWIDAWRHFFGGEQNDEA